jgi:CBS domain-containing protein
MPSAREIMTPDATCIDENESLADAAQKMAQLDVGLSALTEFPSCSGLPLT